MRQYNRRLASLTFLTLLYVVSGKLALQLAFLHPSALRSGRFGDCACCAVDTRYGCLAGTSFVGAFLVNISTAGSLVIIRRNQHRKILSKLAGWSMACAQVCVGQGFRIPSLDFLKFAIFAGLVSTSLSATVGVTSLCAGGFADWKGYWPVWSTWWLGDMGGDILVAPVFLLWASGRATRGNGPGSVWRRCSFWRVSFL